MRCDGKKGGGGVKKRKVCEVMKTYIDGCQRPSIYHTYVDNTSKTVYICVTCLDYYL